MFGDEGFDMIRIMGRKRICQFSPCDSICWRLYLSVDLCHWNLTISFHEVSPTPSVEVLSKMNNWFFLFLSTIPTWSESIIYYRIRCLWRDAVLQQQNAAIWTKLHLANWQIFRIIHWRCVTAYRRADLLRVDNCICASCRRRCWWPCLSSPPNHPLSAPFYFVTLVQNKTPVNNCQQWDWNGRL